MKIAYFWKATVFFFFATTWIIFDKVVVPILRIIQLCKHIHTFNHIQCFYRRPTPFLYNCEKKLWKQTDRKPTVIMLTEHHKERKIYVYVICSLFFCFCFFSLNISHCSPGVYSLCKFLLIFSLSFTLPSLWLSGVYLCPSVVWNRNVSLFFFKLSFHYPNAFTLTALTTQGHCRWVDGSFSPPFLCSLALQGPEWVLSCVMHTHLLDTHTLACFQYGHMHIHPHTNRNVGMQTQI